MIFSSFEWNVNIKFETELLPFSVFGYFNLGCAGVSWFTKKRAVPVPQSMAQVFQFSFVN